jgi:hypothetical protein
MGKRITSPVGALPRYAAIPRLAYVLSRRSPLYETIFREVAAEETSLSQEEIDQGIAKLIDLGNLVRHEGLLIWRGPPDLF